MTEAKRLEMLKRPTGKVDVVLDTDTYNEIDDQFALAYLLSAPEKLNTVAVYAAPFFNMHSTSPEDGMLRSYDEILKITSLIGWNHPELVFKGSRSYLPDETTPVPSPAAEDLARRAMNYTSENPLYVVAIGAITNVASALLLNPEIRERMVLIWLGGHALEWPHNREFNLHQDIAGARVVFGCGVPVVLLPCMGVVSHFSTTEPELRYWLMDKNPLCTYLAQHTIDEANAYAKGKPWSRVIWDVTTVAWLLDEDEKFVQDKLIPSPIPAYDGHWASDPTRHMIKYVYAVNRDPLWEDVFGRLTK